MQKIYLDYNCEMEYDARNGEYSYDDNYVDVLVEYGDYYLNVNTKNHLFSMDYGFNGASSIKYTAPSISDGNVKYNGAKVIADTNYSFAGGTFKNGTTWYGSEENKIDFGFWSGTTDVSASNLTINKNFIAGTLDSIGGTFVAIGGAVEGIWHGWGADNAALTLAATMLTSKNVVNITQKD